MKKNRIFTNIIDQGPVTLKAAQTRGDWGTTQEILSKGSQWIQDQVAQSDLRERSHGGEYVAKKWEKREAAYIVINACSNEPGSGTEKYLLRYEPHKVIEGALLIGAALGAHTCYICIRGEYLQEREILESALEEVREKNLLGQFQIYIHEGAGGTLCGEETALLESLEGRKAMPRVNGDRKLYGCSAVIHGVETVATIPEILRRGAPWFASLGTLHSKGTKLFSLSGHVETPCVVEEEMGVSLKELIETHGGGVKGGWGFFLAVIPGGSSTGFLPKEICNDLCLDFESLERVSSCLGTGGIVVMDKSTDIVRVTARLAQFYQQESCGKCTPCRVGTGWVFQLLERLSVGQGEKEDLDQLQDLLQRMSETSLCAFGGWAAAPVVSLLRYFQPELEHRIHMYNVASKRVKV